MSPRNERPTRSRPFVSAALVVAALCCALGVYLGNRVLAPASGDAPVSVQIRPVLHPAPRRTARFVLLRGDTWRPSSALGTKG